VRKREGDGAINGLISCSSPQMLTTMTFSSDIAVVIRFPWITFFIEWENSSRMRRRKLTHGEAPPKVKKFGILIEEGKQVHKGYKEGCLKRRMSVWPLAAVESPN